MHEPDSTPNPNPSRQNNGQDNKQSGSLPLTPGAIADLRKSGLTDAYIRKMRIRQTVNLQDANSNDYVIPYFNADGSQIFTYSRQRLFRTPSATNPKPPKYYQSPESGPTRVYFPPNWQDELRFLDYIIFTEGEKKCASVAQFGMACIGLGGVDNWRTEKIEIDAELVTTIKGADELGKKVEPTKVSLRITEELGNQLYTGNIDSKMVAPELLETIQEAARLEKTIYIVYDTDRLPSAVSENGQPKFGTKMEVNRSAFTFAMWLLDHGISNIQFVQLPVSAVKPEKTGLDDYVVREGIDVFKKLLFEGNHTFPSLTNVRYFANQVLNQAKIKRRDYIKVAKAIVADLDKHGQRYSASADVHYYFDFSTKSMMQLGLSSQEMRDMRLTDFGKLLFERYGLSSRDESALKEISDQFVNTKGIKKIEARRVSYATPDAIYYQISDGALLKASPAGITIHDNGYDDVLFVRNMVDPLDLTPLNLQQLLIQESVRTNAQTKYDTNRWLEVFKTMQIKEMDGFSLEETQILLSAHFFLNPWFRRWKNLMLPMELLIAEPGSGKSLFYMLRKYVFTGRTDLNRMPQDVRDWYANITDSDGMWIADNVGKLPSQIKQTFSDELARLITDLNPSVSMRKLYTTAEDQKLPVPSTFAITAINNPFTNEDIIQRSLMINMKAIPRGERDGGWLETQINEATGAGRIGWVLQHMLIGARFLQISKVSWDPNYKSRHRLMHYEQCLIIMGQALGFERERMVKIVNKLSGSIQQTIAKNNPIIEGLYNFAINWVKDPVRADKRFNTQDIVDWALLSDDFADIAVLTNSRILSRYMTSHQYDVHESAGIYLAGKTDGRATYKVDGDFHNVPHTPTQTGDKK